jgi:hypothetical protein
MPLVGEPRFGEKVISHDPPSGDFGKSEQKNKLFAITPPEQ